jgi:insulysin
MIEAPEKEVGGRPRIEDLEKPQLDDRSYRVITLPNQLEVLLIHDAGTDKASAALDVNVGSFSDPPDMPGIAHAVEHLLFMGTEKYPEENAYSQYLTRHGGYSNAFTSSTSTNYYFEVLYPPSSTPTSSQAASPDVSQTNLAKSNDESPLWGALDRFGQFFISPLFLEDTVDRELKAVDSEHKMNLQDDTWRMIQLDKALANPDHPYHRFSTGNYKTLHDGPIARGVKIRDEFIKFYTTHYSANRMKLVVLGRESLDTLEAWVEEIFATVPNKNLGQSRWNTPVYTEKELLTQTFARPVLDSRSLELQFGYHDEDEFYESWPSRYLSHLLSHEGPGSVLALIKAKGWANELAAGRSTLCPGSGLFTVYILSTEEGLKCYKEVVRLVFQYIGLMRDQPPQEWVVKEQMQISKVEFRFMAKSPPSQTTSDLAGIMQAPYDRKMLLSGPAIIRKFDAELISEAMSYLRPDNFRMTIVSQDIPGGCDQEEKWYGTAYKVEKIPGDFLAEIRDAYESKSRPAELHFPHKNEFIPAQLEVDKRDVGQPTKAPKLIRHDDNVRVWWKKDDQFRVPKAHVHIYLRTPITSVTPRTTLLCTLYCELVNDALAEFSYDAGCSGLMYNFTNHIGGLVIDVSGYDDKLDVLLEKILLQVRDLEASEDRFQIIHDRMLRYLRNSEYEQLPDQIGSYSEQFKSEKSVMNEDLLPELENVTTQEVQRFFPQILAQCHVEVLAHGNLYKEKALEITDLVERIVKPRRLPRNQVPTPRGLIWPSGSNFIYKKQLKDPRNINHCIEYSLYAGHRYDSAMRAKLLLLGQMTDEPCFHQLRTIEQLGYVVFSGPSFHDTWSGYRILIQSEKDCRYLEGRIENFLNTFKQTLNDTSEEDFENHKRAMINKKLEKPNNLPSENNRFWNHIYSGSYDFLQGMPTPTLSYQYSINECTASVDAATVEKLTKKDMVEFYSQYISTSSSQRSKLSVHLEAQAKANEPSLDEKKTAADKVLDEAKAALSVADSGLRAVPQAPDVPADVKSVVDASQPVLIEDVHAWKASMQVSSAVRPVRDLEEFFEVTEKL